MFVCGQRKEGELAVKGQNLWGYRGCVYILVVEVIRKNTLKAYQREPSKLASFMKPAHQ